MPSYWISFFNNELFFVSVSDSTPPRHVIINSEMWFHNRHIQVITLHIMYFELIPYLDDTKMASNDIISGTLFRFIQIYCFVKVLHWKKQFFCVAQDTVVSDREIIFSLNSISPGIYVCSSHGYLSSTLLACRAVARPHIKLEICIKSFSVE